MLNNELPFLNLGCGRVIMPSPRPAHYELLPPDLFTYPKWLNVDKNQVDGVDKLMNLWQYPWDLPSNSYGGALCAHIIEHIPHEIQLSPIAEHEALLRLQGLQDGWYAFFAELHRVLVADSIIHIIAPYAWSMGAVTDPTHTRLITELSFVHGMGTSEYFQYETGGAEFEMVGEPVYRITPMFQYIIDDQLELQRALQTRLNVAYELYAKMRVVK